MLNLQVLNNVSRAMKYAQGTVMNMSGDDQMHIILHGEAGVVASSPDGHSLAGRLGPGDFFGETALFLGIQIPDSVIALTDIITLPVSRSTVNEFFRNESAIAFEICRALCNRRQSEQKTNPATASLAVDEPPDANESPAAKDNPSTEKAVAAKEAAPGEAHFSLFPEDHGQYALSIDNSDREHLMERTISCPLCRQSFGVLSVRPSKLVVESTDGDMRPRYKGIEPLYYDVITCPHCLYSALSDMFESTKKPAAAFLIKLRSIKEGCGLDFSSGTTTDSVFAGYYLALMCAPQCFPKHQLVTAKLLLKLSRIYQDCTDSLLETRTARQALDTYMYIYQNLEVPVEQEQQLCMVIAELSAKLGENRQAKDFFFKIKINRTAAPLLRRQAENRLYDIRECEK